MHKLTERFNSSIFELEHETEFSNTDIIVIERTNDSGKTRIELPKGIETGVAVRIVQSVFAV